LTDFGGGTFAYLLKPGAANGEPTHRICAQCYQKGQKSILHFLHRSSGQDYYKCQSCGDITSGIHVAPEASMLPRTATRSKAITIYFWIGTAVRPVSAQIFLQRSAFWTPHRYVLALPNLHFCCDFLYRADGSHAGHGLRPHCSSRASLNRCIVALAGGAWTAVPDWALALTEARSSPFLLVKVRFVSGI
jgi:hypothetical protein